MLSPLGLTDYKSMEFEIRHGRGQIPISLRLLRALGVLINEENKISKLRYQTDSEDAPISRRKYQATKRRLASQYRIICKCAGLLSAFSNL